MNCKNASQVQEIVARQPLSGSNALALLLVALHYRLPNLLFVSLLLCITVYQIFGLYHCYSALPFTKSSVMQLHSFHQLLVPELHLQSHDIYQEHVWN